MEQRRMAIRNQIMEADLQEMITGGQMSWQEYRHPVTTAPCPMLRDQRASWEPFLLLATQRQWEMS